MSLLGIYISYINISAPYFQPLQYIPYIGTNSPSQSPRKMCCLHGCASGEYVPPVKKLQPAEIKAKEEKYSDCDSDYSDSNSNRSKRASVPAKIGLNERYRSSSTGSRKSQQNGRRAQGIPKGSGRDSTRGTAGFVRDGHVQHTQGRTAI